VSRTGIRYRHFVEADQSTSDLGVEAARRALDRAGTKIESVDLIIVATYFGAIPLAVSVLVHDRRLCEGTGRLSIV